MFGSAGNEAVVVCVDSGVYALGSNNNGCLGVGDLRSSLQPRKIEALSGKGIQNILCQSTGFSLVLCCIFEPTPGELPW